MGVSVVTKRKKNSNCKSGLKTTTARNQAGCTRSQKPSRLNYWLPVWNSESLCLCLGGCVRLGVGRRRLDVRDRRRINPCKLVISDYIKTRVWFFLFFLTRYTALACRVFEKYRRSNFGFYLRSGF